MNRLTPEEEQRLVDLIKQGFSYRKIEQITGHARITIARRMCLQFPPPPVKKAKKSECDYCGKAITGEREFFRNTRRTKHKFCTTDCYIKYYRAKTAKQTCRRCGVLREKTKISTWAHGMCQNCYQHLKAFNFNEDAAAIFELTKQLKKEIQNVESRKEKVNH